MDKNSLVELMFKTFSSMVEKTFFLVQSAWKNNIPDLRSFIGLNDGGLSCTSQAMAENIVVAFDRKISESQFAFVREACTVYLRSLLTQHDPLAHLKAVEDFCRSKYSQCESGSV